MNAVIQKRLGLIREEMKKEGIAYYMIPTSDFHNSEYVDDYFKAREYFSGFRVVYRRSWLFTRASTSMGLKGLVI